MVTSNLVSDGGAAFVRGVPDLSHRPYGVRDILGSATTIFPERTYDATTTVLPPSC